MIRRVSLPILVAMAALHPLPAHPQALPTADANDQRTPAGRMVEGELQVELEAVEAAWYPRGTDGPRVVTPAFGEVGGPPQVPGPLIRTSAGTPVHVTIRNTLDRPITVRGLLDRASLASGDAPPGPGLFPAFAFAEPLVVPPGETRESRFTPTADVSSFYYGQRLPPGSGVEAAPPFGRVQEGAFMGALVVDALGSPGPSEERVLMITRWNSITEGETQKLMSNGLSWPFTERLEYTVGDTVRWRVINASNLDHPMHLHGFYFTVDALGDTQADTIYAAGERPLVVTQMMEEFSAMRLTWVPEQPGNWLFHCHLVRHMAFPQRFASEGEPGPPADDHDDGHRMDNMAGLITGITVHPAAGAEEPEEAPVRRIDLWTGERPDVYDGDPELGFVVQEGPEPPAPDSTRVPGSPLVLARDEPTEIVVHNRLGIPLSVHWHGLELRSVYDGVGGWSGYPGATRPPIAPGDSVRVLITPPRAGSFMYHIHGEPGHELSQGLYGPFLVLEPGEERDPDADRVYTLADRGATGDAAPAINGRTRPDPQRFQPGRSYRLRFLQISADAFKRLRLLRDGEPVRWRPLAKDGAELPEAARALRPASVGIGVGETYDIVWQPEEPGVYVLEVTTEFFPALGGTVVQRVAFGVGDVAEAELLRAQQPPLAVAALSPAERARYVGTFVGPQVVGGDEDLVLSVWEEQERLYATLLLPVTWDDDGAPARLFPAGEGTLAPGRDLDGLQHLFSERYHFREAGDGGLDRLDAEVGGQVVAELARVPYLELSESRLRRFEGTYGTPGEAGSATVALDDDVLTLVREGRPSERLVPISSTRFAVEGESGMRVDFQLDEGRAVGLTIVSPTGPRTQLPAADSDTVRVAPPTGEREADRASIVAALDEIEPGGTVLFGPGTYLVGTIIPVPQSGITLQAHRSGTTLRGCDPGEAGESVLDCGVMVLQGGGVTLRGFTIEQSQLGICITACGFDPDAPVGDTVGGYRIENNTFRNSLNAIRGQVVSSDATVIRNNSFVNTFHAVGFQDASHLQVLDNQVSAPEPGATPGIGHVSFAIAVAGGPNLVARNRIEGHPHGILVTAFPGDTASGNVIRGNTIAVARNRLPDGGSRALPYSHPADSTIAGVPLALNAWIPSDDSTEAGWVSKNLIERNRILGAEGIGIEVGPGAANRIVGNEVSGIVPRRPFPGNSVSTDPEAWREANGSGIWVSSGSDGNEIVGNTFDDVAGPAVVLEGDRNQVVTRSPEDEVRDRGDGNRVTRRGGAVGASGGGSSAAQFIDTVHVAPPTGETETDRARILAALGEVEPGGTVRFAAGTYLIGESISIAAPEVILVGHPDGTTLRGCNPAEFQPEFARDACNGLELAGARQTVRGFTFEYTHWALHLGCCQGERALLRAPDGSLVEGPAIYRTEGGHRVEGNTFRRSRNGIRMNGDWTEPAIVRNNRFIDNWHSVSINGSTVHLLDNDFSVPEPERVPFYGFPWDAIKIGPPLPLQGSDPAKARACTDNIIAGNRIEGVPDGIRIEIYEPGTSCRDNVIRDNTIIVRRVTAPSPERTFTLSDPSDSTFVGVPLSLLNYPEAFGQNQVGQESLLEDNRIEGNQIIGAHGLGIEILNASRNRIENNSIGGILAREPFPGNTLGPRGASGAPLDWVEADGSGIWVSPGSDENEILGNTFEDITGHAIVLEGDRNRVETPNASEGVLDMGTDNRVSGPAGPSARTPSSGSPAKVSAAEEREQSMPALTDTTRYTIIINGHRQGERRMWQEGPDTWRYEHDGDAYHFPRTERLVLDVDGIPLVMEIDGQRIVWDRWVERYERSNGRARWTAHTLSTLGSRWSRTLEEGEAEVRGSAYYAALHPVHDPGVLARLLLQRDDRTLSLLPDGTARLEPVGERWVEVDDTRRRIRLFAIHGLDLQPSYVWLDDDGATFADEWSVLAGWETAFPELRAASDDALADHHRELARSLVPPARDRPLVIRGAGLFDPSTGAVQPGTTIVVDGTRIAAVGPDDTLDLPADAEVLEAAGRTVMPGLWDMHAHHGFPGPYFELTAPLSLAGGITTARDVGTPTEPMLSLRRRIRAGEAMGPRLLMAGWIGGAGGRPTGTLVGNAAEARAAVDRFAELGYVQIKIYADLPHELVPVVIERAKQHGLRVSGEVPGGMTAREAVAYGYEEIQHIDGLLVPLLGSVLTEFIAQPIPARLQAVNEALAELTQDSEAVQELIQLLASEGVAVDPTLTVFAAQGMKPPRWVARVAARFRPQAQRRILDRHLFLHWPLTPLWDEIFENMSSVVGALHEAGVPVLPGTDTEMAAFDLHQELALYVGAGIPAPDVLTLATLGAARIMGMDDELGSIEPGKLADLILVDGEPTADISDIRRVVSVIKDGRVYDPAAIYRALGIEP